MKNKHNWSFDNFLVASMDYNDVSAELQHYKLTPHRLDALLHYKDYPKKNRIAMKQPKKHSDDVKREAGKNNSSSSSTRCPNNTTRCNAPADINNHLRQRENDDYGMFRVPHKDELFWCFYIMKHGFSKYETVGNQSYIEEKQTKFDYIGKMRCNIDLLRMNKIRPLTEVEEGLSGNDPINMKVFIALCVVDSMNVIVVDTVKMKYYESQSNNRSPVHIIRNKNKQYSIDMNPTTEKVDRIRNSHYRVTSFDRGGLKCLSYYKLEELKDLCDKVGVLSALDNDEEAVTDVNQNKRRTKQDYYNALQSFFL